eukprot:4724347-Amphidinium_carterae.1
MQRIPGETGTWPASSCHELREELGFGLSGFPDIQMVLHQVSGAPVAAYPSAKFLHLEGYPGGKTTGSRWLRGMRSPWS